MNKNIKALLAIGSFASLVIIICLLLHKEENEFKVKCDKLCSPAYTTNYFPDRFGHYAVQCSDGNTFIVNR